MTPQRELVTKLATYHGWKADMECFNCGRKGHLIAECISPVKNDDESDEKDASVTTRPRFNRKESSKSKTTKESTKGKDKAAVATNKFISSLSCRVRGGEASLERVA